MGKEGDSKSGDSIIDTTTIQTTVEVWQQAPQYLYPTGTKLVIVMASLMLGTTLMSLDTTIISVATPQIATEFRATTDVGWYGSAYGMTLTAFTPIAANVYKYFDPKAVYLAFIFIFEIGSIICASAPTSPAFIVGRAIAGLGAAGLLQGAFGILTYVCTLEMRPLFLGMVICLFGLFASIGPVIGGALTEHATWRWCFWINLPIGGVVFFLVVLFLNLKGVDQSTRKIPMRTKILRMDMPGVVLMVSGVTCLFLALQEGSSSGSWSSATPVGLFVGFALIAILFGIRQWMAKENATIPIRYLKNRTVIWGSLYLFWDNMASYLVIYYMPFYFQAALDQTALSSGISYMSLAIPQMIGLLAGGGITTVTGHYMPVILFAQVLCAVGAGLLTTVRTETSTVVWAVYMVLTGLGLGLGVNIPHIAVQAVMETDNDVFIANGIASFFGQLGGSLAISIGNAIAIDGLHKSVPTVTSAIRADDVINAPRNITLLVASNIEPDLQAVVEHGLRQAWAIAVSHVNIFLVAIICISVPTALGMEWLNIKKVSEQREEEKKRKFAEGGSPAAVEAHELRSAGA